MEEDEHDHGLGFNFHGLELILGWTYGFSGGSKSAGKITGLEVRGEDVALPQWTIHNSRALFFYFLES